MGKDKKMRCPKCGTDYSIQDGSPVCAPDGAYPGEPPGVFYAHVGDPQPMDVDGVDEADRNCECPKCGEPLKAVRMENCKNAGDKP